MHRMFTAAAPLENGAPAEQFAYEFKGDTMQVQ